MAHILHLAPAGTGKTARLLAILRAFRQAESKALPKVWALLATRRQALSFRQRLMELEEEKPVYCNIEFFNFYSLNARLLKIARQPARRLNKSTRLALLRQLLRQMAQEDQLDYFRRIADTRGFASILAELIDELKQAGLSQDKFKAKAESKKDQEIARIYERYQALLKDSKLVDVEGEGWLALATLGDQPAIASDVDLLLVDGYDQFTPVQAQMLAALAGRIENVHITLTDIPSAHAEALPHRSLRARERLEEACKQADIRLEIQPIAPNLAERQADLQQLSERIFRDLPAATGGAAIQLFSRPNPAAEVKRALRKIKGQLLAGVQPDDILVALRDWRRYATHFETGGADYELPLLLHYERELQRAPVIAILIDMLGMAPQFRRHDLLDVLRSPYIDAGLSREHIDLLDRISMERQFLGGAPSGWLDLVKRAGQPLNRDRQDEPKTVLTDQQRETLSSRLDRFFRGITAPKRAEAADYTAWLEALLSADQSAEAGSDFSQVSSAGFSLNIIERARQNEGGSAALIRRDMGALKSLKGILREMAANDDVLRASFGQASHLSWSQFWLDLGHALRTTAAEPFDLARTGKVLVTTAAEARGLPHRHVYILGLAEGLFPAEISEDPLYLDSEREALHSLGIPLVTQAQRNDDQGLFYELISLPRETLTLSRPTFQAGKAWNESHLWRAVRRVYPQLQPETAAVGSVVRAEAAASGAEALLGLAAALNGKRAEAAEPALRVKAWLQLDAGWSAQWRRIEEGRRVELSRLSNQPYDQHSGVLSAPALLGEVARRLGQQRVWSASQLKDYGLCGFRFFAKRLLKLEETAEPEAGFDAAQLGSLNHRILEDTYREIGQRGLMIDESNRQAALAIFAQAADDILERAPALFNFRASATWQEEKQVLRKRLLALIKRDFSADSPLGKFGAGRAIHDIEMHFDDLEIELAADAPPLRIAGYIDRVDRVDGELVLIDYKSGTTPIKRQEMENGRDFQMLVYMLALRSLLERGGSGTKVAGGLFWHVRNLETSGNFSADDEEDEAALDLARQHIARNLDGGRKGWFPAHATALEAGKCARYCEFSHLCRMRVTSPYKTLPLE